MKLVIAVVQGNDAHSLLEALAAEGVRATQINSAGGFLRESNVTIMMGVADDEVERVRTIVRENCHPRTRFVNPLMPIADSGAVTAASPVEVMVSGAMVFVLPVLYYEQISHQEAADA